MTTSTPTTPVRRRMNGSTGGVPIRGLLPLLIVLLLWQITDGARPFLPPPLDWLEGISAYAASGHLLPSILSTLWTFVLGLVVSTVVGVLIGYAVGRSVILGRLFGPLLEYFRFVPSVASVPIVVLLVGYDEGMKILVVLLGAVWPVLLQTKHAAGNLSPALLDLASSLTMSSWTRLRKIIAPLLVAPVLLGVRIATPTVLVISLIVELTTNVPGVGQILAEAQGQLWIDRVYGLVLTCALLAMVVNSLVTLLESYVLRYRRRK